MPKWIEYTGSNEQIVKLLTSSDKFIVDNKWSAFKDPTKLMLLPLESNIIWLKELLDSCGVKRFMFCEPHPYADLIKIWADTGCDVYWKSKTGGASGICHENFPAFAHPNEFEYMLTPFDD